MSDTYQCDRCKDHFGKQWTDEEAMAEFEKAPWNILGDEKAVLCQDCFEEFKKWFGSLTIDDHKKIQTEAMKAYDERTSQQTSE